MSDGWVLWLRGCGVLLLGVTLWHLFAFLESGSSWNAAQSLLAWAFTVSAFVEARRGQVVAERNWRLREKRPDRGA